MCTMLGSHDGLDGSNREGEAVGQIDPELLEILVCPVTHSPLVEVGDWLYATDPAEPRKYPIRDGIPVMLADEAEPVEREEFEKIMSDAGKTPDAT